MHAANRTDLNLLPSAVMIYDERERLQAWNDKVALFYPTIAPWLAVGASLESLAEKFIDAGYNIDPGRQQTLREAIIRNCRQTNHCEVRRATAGFTFSISGWRMAGLSACIPTSPSLTRPDARVTSFMTTFYSPRSRSRSASGTGRSPATACRSMTLCWRWSASHGRSGAFHCVLCSIWSTRTIAPPCNRR